MRGFQDSQTTPGSQATPGHKTSPDGQTARAEQTSPVSPGRPGAGRIRGLVERWRALPEPVRLRHVVWLAALVAVLARYPGLLMPLRADEAGFLMVAQHWHPTADSMYGHYWVDRPPLLIALVALADLAGGPTFLRVVAAVGCGVAVLIAAALAREVCRESTAWAEGRVVPDRAAAWAAVVTAAFLANPLLDSVAAKGEVLGVSVLLGSCLLSLRALQRHSVVLAAGAGVLATLALGLKQNMVGGLVFGAVLLVSAWWLGRLSLSATLRLAGGALLGAALPVAATIAWAWREGVHLSAVAYAVYGFRADAGTVLATQDATAPMQRALLVLATFCVTGMVLVAVWLLARWRHIRRVMPVLTPAVSLMLAVDTAGLALGGSFWQPYLYVLVPPLALAAMLIVSAGAAPTDPLPHHRRRLRRLTGVAVASTLLGNGLWLGTWAVGVQAPTATFTGRAVARVAEPGDTIVVFGGRAEIVRASGLSSPYPYLWSLPMRTLDPDLQRLRRLVTGPEPPTWIVEWVPFDAWDQQGSVPLERVVRRRYVEQFVGCNGMPVWVLRSAQRSVPRLTCANSYPVPGQQNTPHYRLN